MNISQAHAVRRRGLVSSARFLALFAGLIWMIGYNARATEMPFAWAIALVFVFVSYVGLRWPAVSSVLAGNPTEDRLSWSGAVFGALLVLVPLLAVRVTGSVSFAWSAAALFLVYYAFGRLTCAYVGCGNFGNVELRSRIPVSLPALEAAAATETKNS